MALLLLEVALLLGKTLLLGVARIMLLLLLLLLKFPEMLELLLLRLLLLLNVCRGLYRLKMLLASI